MSGKPARKERPQRQKTFTDGAPVLASDIGTAQKVKTEIPGAASGSKSVRLVRGEPLSWSKLEQLKVVACYRPLWELAFELELLCPADSGRSRKRDHSVFDWLLLHVAASLLGGGPQGRAGVVEP